MFAGVADQQQKTGGAGPVGFLYKKLPLVKRRITRAAQCPLWVKSGHCSTRVADQLVPESDFRGERNPRLPPGCSF
jgi:hypothetical protein